jgi:hypothetical protein
VYSIYGGFIEDLTPNQIKLFGGFFFGSTFDGSIVDLYGDATIRGTMTKHDLKFDKKYLNREDTIKYHFKMSPHGIWVGEYVMGSGTAGRAFAKTNLTNLNWKGVEMLVREQSFNLLRDSENLVEKLLCKGLLKPVEEHLKLFFS